MFKNHITIALRNFWRNKGFLFINVSGLALGIAAFLFIVAYVNFEFSYDNFHPHAERLYRVSVDMYKNGMYELSDAECYNLVGETMKQEFEDVEDFINIRGLYTFSIGYNENMFKEDKVLYAEPNFLKIFNFPMLSGNKELALEEPYSIVLTSSMAKKIFDREDPMGKTLILNGRHATTVTAVIEDVPENSHVDFDYLLSYSTGRAIYPKSNWDPNWNGNNGFTYVLLKENADPKSLQEKLREFSKRHLKNRDEQLIIQPIKDIHLYSHKTFEIQPNRNGDAIVLLLIVGFLILGIAWINYINLATSRSAERAKEVGIRKTLGSLKTELIRQFMLESLLVNMFALLLAVLIVDLAYPWIIYSIDITLMTWNLTPGFWILAGIFFVAGTILSGFYPAWILSSYKPSIILKGQFNASSKGIFLRKGLVVAQFIASFILVSGTITIHQQLQFMQNRDLGMSLDQVMVLHAPKNIADSTFGFRVATFQDKLETFSFVQRMGISETLPGHGTAELNSASGSINRHDPHERNAPVYYNYSINDTYLESLDMKLIAGINFQKDPDLNKDKMLINEAALRSLGYENAEEAVGTKIYWGADWRPEIIGVIKDYNHLSLENNHIPILFFYNQHFGSYYTVRLRPGSSTLSELIENIRDVWEESFGDSTFEYFFLDERFNAQYQSDQQFSALFSGFAVLAVFIACLGLLGLSASAVSKRTKEIGIRKVLGASLLQIIGTLSADFMKLILFAITVSILVSSWAISTWLNSYAFRIDLSWWMFIVPALLLIALGMLTVGYHTFRAATTNPVESLRSE